MRIGEIGHQAEILALFFALEFFNILCITNNSGYGSLSPIIKIIFFMKIKIFL